ncbi:protein MpDOXC22 [Marchantia polymorpha subsp. ruderalis]|uniref:Fe2OG dioxygenase domain-containing protein n=2 Tax=Marchantia polymorpha TaxID=3197 RepID=A0A176W6M5_MARPO|nr:hypothetical protein AXG93_2446s1220 [Marchantia polymorpha subsp. ruderalis]PTQ32318.1 hypothetical protein MARPO_0100s0029 [Marchantia polymorpha]BBN06940.1 hypothetical protein Mp_3g25160 [Marchantia polymorpha subsp. ruderalis]|eukprot:PTQ32318.1 hypothetical protein MARPO_0100s0029 [Marchantia polymorpha]
MAPSVKDGGVEVAVRRPDNVHQITSRLFKDPASHQLPERYNWPDYERVDLWTPAEDGQQTVPVIDLAGLSSGDPDLVDKLTKEVGRACEEWGFFQVVNHGVPDAVCDAMRTAGMSFLDMPVELKERATDPVGNYYGYGGRYERLKSRVPWMEFLAANITPACEADRIRLTIWPDGDPVGHAFRTAVKEYSASLQSLSMQILQLLARNIGLPADYYSDFFRDSTKFDSSWRFNRYPPCPPQAVTFGIGPHSDPSVLVMLQQDEVGGLQVLKGETWYSVNPTPGAIIVNVGDCLEAWSNGRYESAVHQVLLTEKQKWRMSVIYALNPPSNILVSAPEELVDEEHPRKFRDFAWPDYIHNMRSNRHRIRDKVALDFITIGAKNRWEE